MSAISAHFSADAMHLSPTAPAKKTGWKNVRQRILLLLSLNP
ncbi:hypothetical protein UUU_27170 [Klebsiella pneumoniae subsp. pneumoniae DSM 30104 = JCM 1662 = NBRC 14940]|nr:hypothetical protein UUU_27170 [Klebsiella pneumoniae subsp. pneumoniae DSM 30104 = JCM 1662 = NBRC 14940]